MSYRHIKYTIKGAMMTDDNPICSFGCPVDAALAVVGVEGNYSLPDIPHP